MSERGKSTPISPPPPEVLDEAAEEDGAEDDGAAGELITDDPGVAAAELEAELVGAGTAELLDEALLVLPPAAVVDALEHPVVVTSPTTIVAAMHTSRVLTCSSPSLAPNDQGRQVWTWVGSIDPSRKLLRYSSDV